MIRLWPCCGQCGHSIKLIIPLIIPNYSFDDSQLFPIIQIMLIIEAGPMVIQEKINCHKDSEEQRLHNCENQYN